MQAVEKPQPSTGVVLGISPGKQNRYTCICCRVKFESSELQRTHFKTEWHLYNLKRKVCHLEPIDLDSFNQIQENAVKDSDQRSQLSSSFVHVTRKDVESSSIGSQVLEDDDWETIDEYDLDDDELVDEDYDEEEIAEMFSKKIPADTCLFCDKKSTSIKTNLMHMDALHGFFIPEEKYLIDLDGLMDYLGLKVGGGSTCLWCNKQFASLHGVRLHMLYKDHCKILYDQAKAIEEFKEYYDYSNQVQIEMKPISELVLAAGRPRPRRRAELDGIQSSSRNRSGLLKQQLLLVQKQHPGMLAELKRTKRSIKKFNSDRAKILLRTGMTNNQTMRGRFRHQNPM